MRRLLDRVVKRPWRAPAPEPSACVCYHLSPVERIEQGLGVSGVVVEVGRDSDGVPAQRDDDLPFVQTLGETGGVSRAPDTDAEQVSPAPPVLLDPVPAAP